MDDEEKNDESEENKTGNEDELDPEMMMTMPDDDDLEGENQYDH